AGAAENDPVLVDDVDRPGRIDVAQDLARDAGRIEDLVEDDPVVAAAFFVGAAVLVEIELRLRTDVESLPGQQRLRLRLHDGDDGLALVLRLRGEPGALPQAGIFARDRLVEILRDTGRDLETALDE